MVSICSSFRLATMFAFLPALALFFAGDSAAASGTCSRADHMLQRTGRGDRDGDGLSNCRELNITGTLPNDADTDDDSLDDGDEVRVYHSDPTDSDSDHDGLDDGSEIAGGSDPSDSDSDDDGIDDNHDATAREQEIEAYVDALTCPVNGAAGSISALGVTVALSSATEFSDLACADLATRLGSGPVFVEIEILEDTNGALSATEVSLEEDEGSYADESDGSGDDGSNS